MVRIDPDKVVPLMDEAASRAFRRGTSGVDELAHAKLAATDDGDGSVLDNAAIRQLAEPLAGAVAELLRRHAQQACTAGDCALPRRAEGRSPDTVQPFPAFTGASEA